MSSKSFSLLVIIAFSTSIINAQQNLTDNFKISGYIKNVEKGRIILKYGSKYNSKKFKEKITDGKFLFTGHVDSTFFARLYYKGLSSGRFYLDSSNINITLIKNEKIVDGRDGPGLHFEDIKGSVTNDLKLDYDNFYKENVGDLKFNYLLYNYLSQKISENPKNKFYFDLLYLLTNQQKFLNYKQFFSLANKIDMSRLHSKEKESLFKSLQNAMYMGIGSSFSSTVLHSQNGIKRNLKKILGKLNLIYVFPGNNWKQPSIHEKYLSLHQKYKSADFNFIKITMYDKNTEPSYIRNDKIYTGNNYYSLDLQEKLKLARHINSYNYLIDSKGKVIEVNISPIELEKILFSRL